MIPLQQAHIIHNLVIEHFGGANGLRDVGALESALARPFQTFDGSELYPSPIEKAAAIGESIIVNHPFTDGNKRTGYVLMESLLRYNGLYITSSDEEVYDFVIGISNGQKSTTEITEWLRANTQSKENSV